MKESKSGMTGAWKYSTLISYGNQILDNVATNRGAETRSWNKVSSTKKGNGTNYVTTVYFSNWKYESRRYKEREERFCSKNGTFSLPFSHSPKVSQIIYSILIRNYDLDKSWIKTSSFSGQHTVQEGVQSSLAERHRLWVSDCSYLRSCFIGYGASCRLGLIFFGDAFLLLQHCCTWNQ